MLLFPDSQFAEFSWHCFQLIHLVSVLPMHNGKPHWHNVYITDAQMEPGRFSFKGFVVLEVQVLFFVTEKDYKNRNGCGFAILFGFPRPVVHFFFSLTTQEGGTHEKLSDQLIFSCRCR